jgi:hypothetical protein
MNATLTVIAFTLLAAITWQDVRTRSVMTWLLPALGVVLAVREYQINTGNAFFMNAIINSSILLVQFAFIHLWLFLRNGHFTKLMDVQIGWGDVVFLVCLAPSFAPLHFCLFVTAGTIFSLVLTLLRRRQKESIPLAGHLSIFLALWLMIAQVTSAASSFSDDSVLTTHLISFFRA